MPRRCSRDSKGSSGVELESNMHTATRARGVNARATAEEPINLTRRQTIHAWSCVSHGIPGLCVHCVDVIVRSRLYVVEFSVMPYQKDTIVRDIRCVSSSEREWMSRLICTCDRYLR